MSVLLMFLIISSGSFIASAWFGRKYADVLPLTIFSTVIVLYVMGIAGHLYASVYVILILSAIGIIASIIKVVANKSYFSFQRSFFSEGFWVFLLFFASAYIFNIGKLAMEWDEFSHWADVVKAMVYIDDFAANPASHSAFRSYPPAMSLFQYFDQRLIGMMDGNAGFIEGRLYFSYQIFTLSLFIPFFSSLSIKKLPVLSFAAAIAFTLPAVFYEFYRSIYIDPFLGILSGFILSYILYMREQKGVYKATVLSSLFVLSLTKDSGTGLAALLAIIYGLEEFKGRPVRTRTSAPVLIRLCRASSGLIAVMLARYSWKTVLEKFSTPISFDERIDLGRLFSLLLGKDPQSYQAITLQKFGDRLLHTIFTVPKIKLDIPISLLFLILMSIIFFLYFIDKKEHSRSWLEVRSPFFLTYVVSLSLSYIAGICISYLFKFSEFEAIRLASFDRYVYVLFTMLNFLVWVMLIKNKVFLSHKIVMMILLVFMFFVSFSSAGKFRWFLEGKHISYALSFREQYIAVEAIEKQLYGQSKKIYFISQGDSGYDYWAAKYILRPQSINDATDGWSIAYSPLYRGDIWSVYKPCGDWEKELKDHYDYVFLYQLDDSFTENYSSLFRHQNEIHESSLYRIEKVGDVKLVPVEIFSLE